MPQFLKLTAIHPPTGDSWTPAKMLNRGTTDTDPILVGTNSYGTDQKTRASYFMRSANDGVDLPQLNETSDKYATGIAGAWSSALGYTYAGSMSDGANPFEYPAQWLPPNNSTIIRNSSGILSGVWNDVNRNQWPAGTQLSSGGSEQAIVRNANTGGVAPLPTGTYDSAAAEGINIQRWVGGRVLDHTDHDLDDGIPAIWSYDPNSGQYTLHTVLSATNWPGGRQGTVFAISDDTGDANGPYAVGYIYQVPGAEDESETTLPRPFIWSYRLNKVRLLPTYLPSPYQVSNKLGGSNVITSLSNGVNTWVWSGDPNVATDGGVITFQSFLNPDEVPRGGRGVNDAFFFGGNGFTVGVQRDGIGIYDAGSINGWGFASATPNYNLAIGSVSAGSLSNLEYADGKNVRITAIPEAFPGARVISLETTATVSGARNELALRYNFAKDTGGLKVNSQFYNWTTQTWDAASSDENPLDEVFVTKFISPAVFPPNDYIQAGTGLIKARVQAYKNSDLVFTNYRKIAFEHMRILAR